MNGRIRPHTRVIALILIACLSATSATAGGEAGRAMLSPPSSFSALRGHEFKDAAQIQMAVLAALKGLKAFDADALRAFGSLDFSEKTVFGNRVRGTIFFDAVRECTVSSGMASAASGSYIMRARTGNGDYYCLVSKPEDGGRFSITVVPARILIGAMRDGTVQFTHSILSSGDRGVVDRYIEHEVSTEVNEAVDGWIRRKIGQRDYAVGAVVAARDPLYKNAPVYGGQAFRAVLDGLRAFFKACGVGDDAVDRIMEPLEKKPVVLVPYGDENELPLITLGGTAIRVMAHSSEFATYVFMPAAMFEGVAAAAPSSEAWQAATADYVARLLVHEAVARCGEGVTVEGGRAVNFVDGYYDRYLAAGRPVAVDLPPPAVARLASLAPVNLVELELRNDYAGGTEESRHADKKTLVRRILYLTLAGSLAAFWTNRVMTVREEERRAAEVAASVVTPQDVARLIDEIARYDADIVVKARNPMILGRVGATNAIDRIVPLLDDSFWPVREAAAIGLGMMDDPRVIGPLIKSLEDRRLQFDSIPRGALNTRPIPDVDDIYHHSVAPLSWIGEPAVGPLVKALDHRYWWVQRAAAQALAIIGKPAVLPLIAELDAENKEKKKIAIQALGLIGDKRAIAPVWEILVKTERGFTDDMIVNDHAARALSLLGAMPSVPGRFDEHIENLIYTLEEKVPGGNARKSAEPAAAATKPQRLSVLLKSVYGDEWRIRRDAAAMLGDHKKKEAVDALIDVLQNDVEGVQRAAVSSLGKIGEKSIEPLFRLLQDKRLDISIEQAATDALAMVGPAALPDLRAALKNRDPSYGNYVRKRAAMTLGKMHSADAVGSLVLALSGEREGRVREAIVVAFDRLGGAPRATQLVIDALGETSSMAGVRVAAAEYLGNRADANAVEPLIAALRDPDASVRYAAVVSLWKLRDNRAVKPLCDVLKDRHPTVRFAAALALGDFNDLSARAPLESLGNDPYAYIRKAAEKSLDKIRNANPAQDNITPGKRLRDPFWPVNYDPDRKAPPVPEKPVSKPAGAALHDISTSIRHLASMRYGELWRAENIAEILWREGTGVISKAEAKEALRQLAPETGATDMERDAVFDAWMAQAGMIVAALAVQRKGMNEKPSDDEIRAIATKVREAGIEVFMPASQLPNGTQSQFRRILDTVFGDRLRVYQKVEDLAGMMKNPAKSVVMTVDLTDSDIQAMAAMKTDLGGVRFMNFERMDVSTMPKLELENYLAETVAMLVVARIITPEEARDRGSSTYRMLAHLLEGRMDDPKALDNYILTITDNSADTISRLRYLLKAVLKAVPVGVYKILKPAVEVLWSA